MKYYAIAFFVIFLASCGTENQNIILNENDKILDTAVVAILKEESPDIVENSIIDSRYQYDKEWEVFKEAIINKDVKGVSSFASSDAIDAEELIIAMGNEIFLKQLKETSYEDLTVNTTDLGVSIEFHAVESSVEDGNDIGSAITISFTEGEQFLELDYFIAAN